MHLALLTLLLPLAAAAVPPAMPTDLQAQAAHAAGYCGKLGPGTGLKNGDGWIVSMLPGKHEFRVIGPGTVRLGLHPAAPAEGDFLVGATYRIRIQGWTPETRLEWRWMTAEWAPVSKFLLYPATTVQQVSAAAAYSRAGVDAVPSLK